MSWGDDLLEHKGNINVPVLDKFIVLEGIDGSGTTTQLKLLEQRFASAGISFWITCEPTTGPVGQLIRSVLGGEIDVLATTLAHLFVADRNEHVYHRQNGIAARVSRGEIVVCDRYLFSSLAYQSVECGFDYVYALNGAFPLPSDVVFLEVPVEEGDRRSAARGSREIFEHTEFQRKVIDTYERTFGIYNKKIRIHRIDGTLPPASINEKIWSVVESIPI